ncbi:MAG TPA: hypothetical protein VFS52_22190 [Steroidobacteraceae bacterium]|jgi:hypothetical protein|nr:hypothetical protein [Steroidobacteraceae bacterium]
MRLKLSIAAVLFGSLMVGQALADCPGPFVADKKRSYQAALTFEKQGKLEQALRAYRAAEGYACEPVNPVEADAAARAAPLGLTLGSAAEKSGNTKLAFELYEAGGHFAHADRMFMELTRAKADEPAAFQAAREHFDTRSLESFQTNNAAAIKAAGAYRPDPKLIAEVMAMPAKGFERAAQREAAAFSETYLREYVQLVQSRADDPTDAAAVQRTMSAHQAFAQKWRQEDPLETSRRELQTMRMWGLNGGDERLAKQAEAAFTQRADQHAQLLVQKYSGAPKLLDAAMSFITMQSLEPSKTDARVAAIKAQAAKLGDEASAKKRYALAAEYYDVAGDAAKADAARQKQNQLAMQKMQPQIDAAQRQAAELQKEFSDPAKVQAMREQAEAARKALQQQQASAKAANKKAADELEKELGL